MNKTVVIYQSKYGSTKKYAQWISTELKADLLKKSNVKAKDLEKYETIIYGGWLCASGISGVSLITKNFSLIKEKNIVIFTCGLADPKDKSNLNGIESNLKKSFTEEMIIKINFFHLRGAIDYKKLGVLHKIMMSMLKSSLAKKDSNTLSSENKQFLESYGKTVDFCEKSTIIPLLHFIETL